MNKLKTTVCFVLIILLSACVGQQINSHTIALPLNDGFVLLSGSELILLSDTDSFTLIDTTGIYEAESGVIAVSSDEIIYIFDSLDMTALSSPVNNVYSACTFDEKIFLGGKDGRVYYTSDGDWITAKTAANGNVTGLVSDSQRIVGITDKNEIIVFDDNWSVMDFNGYYGRALQFSGIIHAGDSFIIYGEENGMPVIIYSHQGGVWSDRKLEAYEGDNAVALSGITSLCSDGKQLYAGLSDGSILVLPECVNCNYIKNTDFSYINAVASNGKSLLIVGNDGNYSIEDIPTNVKRISVDEAASMVEQGGVIIDLCSQEEYILENLPNSVNVPFDSLSEWLDSNRPDKNTVLIFCCKTGNKSYEATKLCIDLGYSTVYDLGGIDDIDITEVEK